MAGNKRDMQNFQDFPGYISKDKKMYVFPPLYNVDARSRKRIWTLYIRLIDKKEKDIVKGSNWDMDSQNPFIIKKEYLQDEDIPDNYISESWTETGIIGKKITRSQPTYFIEAKNKGKKDERNNFKTALIDGRNKWSKKVRHGSQEEKDMLKQEKNEEKGEYKKRKGYFPMLLEEYIKKKEYIIFPAVGQLKLDGVRSIMYFDKDDEDVVIYSRTKIVWEGFSLHKKEIKDTLKEYYDKKNDESLYLDGEFYKHGKKLQEISSIVKTSKNNDYPDKTVCFYVFDCFYPSKTDMKFIDRYNIIKSIFSKKEYRWIKLVECFDLKDDKETYKQYDKSRKNGYEGIVIRNRDSPYKTHPQYNSDSYIRSTDAQKLKNISVEEFKISGYTEGKKGKDKGALIWILETENGHKFNITEKNKTVKERKEQYKNLQNDDKLFDKKYKNKMMMVSYNDKSEPGIPLRAKAVGLKESE